ncbi:DUF1572 domain-containing protein [Deinococcus cavernae]|uniref:DUF1572 domain-containing protein n=1 Tax=Deinococcus cavernae TaxID=2320857 RepID=A0A418V5A8_9DEIO|nr:DUF1572 family protein [Deinococcus cavernae]RJF71278.1 DUF1572 domain-containing protein [Deinococcus cavernae]
MSLADLYLRDVRGRMRGVKALGNGALTQLREEEWHLALSGEGNSAAVLIQHLSGNMHSRWGAFQHGFTAGAEGETAGRDRDREFTEGQQTPAQLLALWDEGWQVFLEALDNFKPDDLTAELTIRSEQHTILEAIQRQVAHYSGHVYQLVFLVKTLRGREFRSLSILRGGSAAFNAEMMRKPR